MKSRRKPSAATPLVQSLPTVPVGGFVDLDGETYYRISAYHRMAPFLVSVPSDTDLWMFIASGGGLTAGRVDAQGALFPYRTVDQLHDDHHHTGPITLVRIPQADGSALLWEPFAAVGSENPAIERNLYKNTVGNRLVFEEVNHTLGLAFRYVWSACDKYGWVRSATLENRTSEMVEATVLDGLRNVLPFGAPLSLYQQASNLVDAYKKTEVDPETGLAIFSLTAGITDKAEAVEVLRANTVWCCGLDGFRVHLSRDAIASFRYGRVIPEQSLLNGARGNYLVSGQIRLAPAASSQWHLVGDTGRDHLQIAELRRQIIHTDNNPGDLLSQLEQATDSLRRNVASADGLQLTGRDTSWSHHFANVLFNNMRGGVFAAGYELPTADLIDFLETRSKAVAERQQALLAEMPATVTIQDLHDRARATGDADFQRLCLEYLPLHFGRRHGDPSRPWNRFEIRVRDKDGQRALNYEGNWRDIFQNWEALASSYPGFLPNFVAKFVNASTIDGFNPYRINREGVEWEEVNPEDPWSNIGYWGDHQIIYLLKLLEAWGRTEPEAIEGLLDQEIFSYAEVPYRLKSYAEILRNPSDTITFDHDRADRIAARVADGGTDGKLVTGMDGQVHHANLLEKLLVPALSKLSNLIPDAGIWMNTQRPEWNDANNALAGGGASVVTLCYLRRYLAFLARQLEAGAAADRSLPVADEVIAWLTDVESALVEARPLLQETQLTAKQRKLLMDSLGLAFEKYRETVYDHGFTGRSPLPVSQVVTLCHTALDFLDWGLQANRRPDGLYHTYNLTALTKAGDGMEVDRLSEMLEGQVAALSSGVLDPTESVSMLERMYASDLYRPDQRSFMLYPEKVLPNFLDKNTVPSEMVDSTTLLKDLIAAGDSSLLARDADGVYRFNGNFRNAEDLNTALDNLAAQSPWTEAVSRDRAGVLEVFESVFHHSAYTGRSGTMYRYEGLGCIYWHMVAKLLLAVQETFQRAVAEDPADPVCDQLAAMYFRVRQGIGYEKTVPEYGAFPTDPYSHTPPDGGARQPGMTGQVKEEILTRWGELGLQIRRGQVCFCPRLLEADEFLGKERHFHFVDHDNRERSLALTSGSLAFTVCQVPVIYDLEKGKTRIRVRFTDGTISDFAGNRLDSDLTRDLFARSGRIEQIRVGIPEGEIYQD